MSSSLIPLDLRKHSERLCLSKAFHRPERQALAGVFSQMTGYFEIHWDELICAAAASHGLHTWPFFCPT